MVICLEGSENDLHMVQLMPVPPHLSHFIKIHIGLTFVVLAYPGCPGKEANKWVSVLNMSVYVMNCNYKHEILIKTVELQFVSHFTHAQPTCILYLFCY